MNTPDDIQTASAPADSLHSVVGASGQWFSYFMRDGSIEEVWATDKEAALETLCRRLGKSRYWTLEEVEDCMTRENNEARMKRQGKITL